MDTNHTHSDNAIELILPARTEFTATVRLLAASIGADLSMSIDEIDDMRLALNEVFASATDIERDARVSITFRTSQHAVEVTTFVVGDESFELDSLALTILRSVVDDIDTSAGAITFTKLARESVS